MNRTDVLGSRCTMLAPGPITNSGKADGGWMDRVGITATGLGHIFGPPNAMGEIDCFYSNDAYRKAGFCTMQIELHPPLEVIGDTCTPQSFAAYLDSYLNETENDHYCRGDFHKLDIQHVIEDPAASINSPASTIVQVGFEVPITPGPNIPKGLTATTYSALIYFKGKGTVLFKANNFERHSPPLDYQTILSSITYKPEVGMYRGADPTLSGLHGMSAFMSSGGDLRPAKVAEARAQCKAGSPRKAEVCLHCGADSQPNGEDLMACGRCKVATYCQRSCATADWKRHRKAECQPKT